MSWVAVLSTRVSMWVGLQVEKAKNLVYWVKHGRNRIIYYHKNVHSTYLEEASFGEGKTKDRCTCFSLTSSIVIYISSISHYNDCSRSLTEDVVEDVDSFCSAVAGESCVSRGRIGSSVSKGSSSAVTASRAGNGCCLPCACKMELTFRILSLE
jgi:hypothetical protein